MWLVGIYANMVAATTCKSFSFYTILAVFCFAQIPLCYSSSSEHLKFSAVDTKFKVKRQATNQIHQLKKRSTQSCADPPVSLDNPRISKSQSFDTPSDNATDFDTINLLWTGDDNSTRVVALMHGYGEANSSVYYSLENETFVPSSGLGGLTIMTMDRNPGHRNHVLILGVMGLTYKSCLSTDSGKTFACYKMLENHSPIGTLLFSEDTVMTIMQPDNSFGDHVLVLSVDMGKTWTVIAHRVKAAIFKPGSQHLVFALTEIEESSPFASLFGMPMDTQLKLINVADLSNPTSRYLKDLGKAVVTGIQYAGDLLHVVTEDDDGHKVLKISSDDGESFNDTHLPTTLSGQYINILETDNKLIFVQVTSNEAPTFGTLYTSGKEGLFYTKSLDRHLSKDFYNVLSMDGVYISTQMREDKSLVTVITMDRGAEWKPIQVANCGKADCTLQIYGAFLIEEHQKSSTAVLSQGPQSSYNAKGLIVVQGMLGSSIPYHSGNQNYSYEEEPGVFISGDGGYTWKQAGDMAGAYHLLVEDSGAVLQALPINDPLKSILFSVDEGTCWYSIPLQASLHNFNVKGFATQPGQKSLRLGIIGHGQLDNSQITWEIIDVDFEPILQSPCTSDDMENWDANAKCYLGQKRSYQRIKKSSWCYLSSKVNVDPKVQYCTCSRDDYQCDYGYIKNAQKVCVKDKQFNNTVTYCLDGRVYTLESSGYRKLPGDECKPDPNGSTNKYEGNYTTRALNKSCDQDNLSSYLDTNTVINKLCQKQQAPTPDTGKKGLVTAVVILTLISTVLCIAVGLLYCRYTALRRHSLFGQFDDPAWSVNSESPIRPSSHSGSEALRINAGEGGGRSYTRLKETGAESDVDLLNM